jgi:hypothetical protein
MFRLMEPLHHDADPNRSQVLAHIMANMQCDLGRASRAFNSMRHPKSKVLVFDHVHRMWKGCDWLPENENSKDAMILVEHRALERRVIAMDGELKKALKEIKRLNKQMADLYTDAKEMDDGTTNWFEEMKKTLEMTDKKPSKRRVQQPMNTTESLVAQAWS